MSLRVTDSYMARILVQDNHRSLSRMLRLQRMASTLRRVNTMADDPIAVGAINRYRHLIDSNQQYLRNSDRARNILYATDTALQDITSLLTDARVVAVRESSAQATSETQDQAAREISTLIDQVMSILNVSVEGDFIFGGHRTDIEPFQRLDDAIFYQGDDGIIQAQTGPNSTLAVNTPGSVFMNSNSAVLMGGVDVAPVLQLTDNLADLNLGNGWEEGSFTIQDNSGTNYLVDLTGVSTIADVISRIDSATSGAVTAAISTQGDSLVLTGTGPLTVTEVDEGHTAQSLGLVGSSVADELVGNDIRTAPTPSTLLADIPALDGSLPLGSIDIEMGNTTLNISFFPATTVGHLQSIINSAFPSLELRIEGDRFSLVSGSSEHFSVTNGDASATASLLGLEGTGTPTRLFGVLADLKAALEAHDPDAIRDRLAELDAVENLVLTETIKVGGKENSLDWMEKLLRQRDERLQANLSREWDADLAEVATDLSQAEAAYQASLLVTSRLYEINLMKFLR